MKTLLKMTFAISTLIAIPMTTMPANAACVNSVWQKTSGNSLASTINGRQCGQNMAVKLNGATGNTGWLNMTRVGPTSLRATYVDNTNTTKINMETSGTKMFVQFQHQGNNGTGALTNGSYNLVSYN